MAQRARPACEKIDGNAAHQIVAVRCRFIEMVARTRAFTVDGYAGSATHSC
jgi:hypothetical protein